MRTQVAALDLVKMMMHMSTKKNDKTRLHLLYSSLIPGQIKLKQKVPEQLLSYELYSLMNSSLLSFLF